MYTLQEAAAILGVRLGHLRTLMTHVGIDRADDYLTEDEVVAIRANNILKNAVATGEIASVDDQVDIFLFADDVGVSIQTIRICMFYLGMPYKRSYVRQKRDPEATVEWVTEISYAQSIAIRKLIETLEINAPL